MQFITNKIKTGKAPRFEDFVKQYREEHQIKTAAVEEKNVKVAAEQEEADSSGQLDVKPLHQTGESTTMPKAGPSAKKEGKDEGKSAKAKTDEPDEAQDSGQPKAEGSEKFTNDPKTPSKEEKGGSTKGDVKVAGCEKCKDDDEEEEKKEAKKDDDEEETKEAKKDDDEEETKEAKKDKDDDDEEIKEAALEDLPQAVQDKIKGKKDGKKDDTKDCSDGEACF